MTRARKPSSRTYLRAAARREQLLGVAADLVGKRGWDALGMISLAEAAGVSRQLVYEHFENLDRLHFAVTRHLFDEVMLAVSEVMARHPDDLAAAVRTGVRRMLALPRGARLALRELSGDLSGVPRGPSTPVRRLRVRMRQRVTDLWAAPIRRQTGVDERRARALAWVLTVASWSLLDLVDDGSFTREAAVEFYVAACLGAVAAFERKAHRATGT